LFRCIFSLFLYFLVLVLFVNVAFSGRGGGRVILDSFLIAKAEALCVIL
jgi:hypothetical protein